MYNNNTPFYGNPYMPGTQIQPNSQRMYQQPYQAYQPYQTYQTPIQQIQNTVQQSQQPQVMWEIVSDFETIRAANASLDGQPKYYLMSDGMAIYRKQMMNDGTSRISKYELITEDAPKQAENGSGDLMAAIQSLNSKVDVINDTVNQITSMWSGGVTDDES